MYCPKCGIQIADGDAFCRQCGAPLENKSGGLPLAASKETASGPRHSAFFQEKPTAWYYYVKGNEHGPLSETDLVSAIEKGIVDNLTLVRAVLNNGDRDTACYRIEDLQRRKALPAAKRVLPPLPTSVTLPQIAAHLAQKKFEKPFDEMTPQEISQFTNEATKVAGWELAIKMYKGTQAETILRREHRKYQKLKGAFGLGVALGAGLGWVSRSIAVGIVASLILGIAFMLIAHPLIYRSERK